MKKQLLQSQSLVCQYRHNKNSKSIASSVSHTLSLLRQQQQQQQQQQQLKGRRRCYHNLNENRKNDKNTDVKENYNNGNASSTIPYMGQGVKVGQYATMTRTYSSKDVDNFGRLIQDFNPIHSSSSSNSLDIVSDKNNDDDVVSLLQLQRDAHEKAGLIQYQEDFDEDNGDNDVAAINQNTTYSNKVPKALVHGIFVGGIFSSILAHISPGCVYINQSLDFMSPVFVHDTVVGCISIEKIRRFGRKGGIVIQCQTSVYKYKHNYNSDSINKRIEPTPAQISIQGRANVWLPIGYQLTEAVNTSKCT